MVFLYLLFLTIVVFGVYVYSNFGNSALATFGTFFAMLSSVYILRNPEYYNYYTEISPTLAGLIKN
jgi:hypothetical protein